MRVYGSDEQLVQATAMSSQRGSKSIAVDDLFFLIRHDKAKVNRLRTYLSWKDVRKNAKDQDGGGAPEADLLDDDAAAAAAGAGPGAAPAPGAAPDADRNKFRRQAVPPLLWDVRRMFPEPVPEGEDEDEEEAQSDYNPTLERLRRADERTRNMTREEYVHWSECRQASFTYRKAKRFRDFCNMAYYTESRPNDDIVDILGFLAFEVVARLTEGALRVKERTDMAEQSQGGKTDPGPPLNGMGASLAPDTAASGANSEPGERFLFSGPKEERSSLEPWHIFEAYRILQTVAAENAALRNFTGGPLRTRPMLI